MNDNHELTSNNHETNEVRSGVRLVSADLSGEKKVSLRNIESLKHEVLLAEIFHSVSDRTKSYQFNQGQAACGSCDKRLALLQKASVHTSAELIKHVEFIPPTKTESGHFEFNFIFNGKLQALPRVRMENDARNRTRRLLIRLNRGNAAAARAASVKLQKLYFRNDVCIASNFDLTQDTIYLPLHCVIKASSSSHQARVTECPNVSYDTQFGQVSFNECQKQLSTSNPRLFRCILANLFSISSITGDVEGCFNSIKLTYDSSLQCMSHCYKSFSGTPTYVLKDCPNDTLYPLRKSVLGFGTHQAPGVNQYTLLQSVSVYERFHNTLSTREAFLTVCCKQTLENDTHVDDFHIWASSERLERYLSTLSTSELAAKGRELDPSFCPSSKTSPETGLSDSLKTQFLLAQIFLIDVCHQFVRILNFSSFRVKRFYSENPHTKACLDSIVEAQSICPVKPEQIEASGPSEDELREQMSLIAPNLKLGELDFQQSKQNEHNNLKFEQKTNTEQANLEVEHLGSLYTYSTFSLKKKHLSFLFSDGKTHKVRSPDFHTYDELSKWCDLKNPIFTKRTIMSLLSYNTDPSGLVLSIFRCKVKILLRSYLKMRLALGKPSSWEDKLESPETKKLLHCAECYFVLIKAEVQLPPLAKCSSERYLFCASDGGKMRSRQPSRSFSNLPSMGNLIMRPHI